MNAAVLTSTSLLPPVERRWIGPLLLALVAHALLVAGLTWGISWNKDTPVHVVAQAELWSALP
jgi:colicin import membrane protein